ncbi:hypothetical protein [Acinetobacter equi]|uniref:CopG family transcriptional regulator n=1 Tax=Acinetobacter equi TaxID=1324350 RepID=A0A0N9W2B4_9GAMM|nr:hypothetical protein [Acinetobacter equi]ALH95690.1 hypothetical protein AOY20_09185 [Acinetobacter equi]
MTRRKTKKDASVTIHMPQFRKDQLTGLAEQQRAGQGASEFIFETIVMPYLQKVEHETKVRQKIFGLTENYKNDEHRTDLSDR